MGVTRHAKRRIRERCGVSRKEVSKVRRRAWEHGITHKDANGELKDWMSGLFRSHHNATDMRIYGDACYLFTKNGNTLITVITVPATLMTEVNKIKIETGRGKLPR